MNTGARWEITVDGRPRTYDHNRALAIEAAEYLMLKNPAVDVTVHDLEQDPGDLRGRGAACRCNTLDHFERIRANPC